VLVGGNHGTNGLVDGLLSLILWNQTGHQPASKLPQGELEPPATANNLIPEVEPTNLIPPPSNPVQKTVADNLKIKLDRQPPPPA
jgi:hypothetical protein